MAKTTIQIKDVEVRMDLDTDYISMTDIAKTGRGRTNGIKC